MTTVELKLSLPDQLAEEARAAGLFTLETVAALLKMALRAKRARGLFEAADAFTAAKLPQMSMQEIQAEVDAVRRAALESALAFCACSNAAPEIVQGKRQDLTPCARASACS
ncbi:MAG: hypothetical protein FJY54_01220 [Betaproteobacteria bacterium]|nr:hypothetical protein [Betaproteobacteria bacterium]